MLNLSIIIHNHYPENLTKIITLLKNKIIAKEKTELIIINEQKYINQNNINTLEIVNAKCQEKNIPLKIVNLKHNEFIYSRLGEVITGDIVIFTSSSYIPDNHWLENIILTFANCSFNIFVGQIIEQQSEHSQSLINDSSIDKMLYYLQIWQKQMVNLAIRKEFLKQIKYFSFLDKNYFYDVTYYRLIRELENEINYLPNAIVRKNIHHT